MLCPAYGFFLVSWLRSRRGGERGASSFSSPFIGLGECLDGPRSVKYANECLEKVKEFERVLTSAKIKETMFSEYGVFTICLLHPVLVPSE